MTDTMHAQRVFCFGDSNTFGYDPHSMFGDAYPDAVRWTGLLANEQRVMINGGQNGLCIPGEGSYGPLASLIRSREPDLLVVMLGTNDLLEGASADAAAARILRLGAFLKGALEGIPVLLIAPPKLRPGTWVSEAARRESEKLGARYRAVAQRLGFGFADAGSWELPLAYDGVHMTEEGHRRFAERLGEVLDGRK